MNDMLRGAILEQISDLQDSTDEHTDTLAEQEQLLALLVKRIGECERRLETLERRLYDA